MCREPGDRRGLLSEVLDPGALCPLQLRSPNFPCPHFQGHKGPEFPLSRRTPALCRSCGSRRRPHGGGSPRLILRRGAIGPSGRESSRRGRGRERGDMGEVFGFFWLSRCTLRKPFQLSRSFSGWAGGGDAIYRRGERGAAESGVRPPLGSVSPVPAPARPGPGEGRGQPW